MAGERFISAEELATLLGVSRSAIYKMAERGEIPHYRFGSRLLFSFDEVRRDLEVPSRRVKELDHATA